MTAVDPDSGRDEALQLSLDALQPAWRSVADEVIDSLIRRGVEWTADDVRAGAGVPYATGSASALGALIRRRAVAGEIVQTGWATSRQPQRHGGVVRIWQAARP